MKYHLYIPGNIKYHSLFKKMDNKYITDANIVRTSHEIIQILKEFGLFEWFHHDESIYVGGSMLSYILSHDSKTQSQSTPQVNKYNTPHDIDIYTTNHVNTIRFFNEHKKDFDVMSTNGCIINFTHKERKNNLYAQLITSEVDDFYSDVLGNYDCDLVCIGYHPASNNVIIHKRLRDAISSKKFKCYKHLSSENRSEKLEYRIKTWYDSEIEYVGEEFGRFDAYYDDCEQSIQTFVASVPPKYIQLFYNLYKCIGCNKQNKLLLCEECRDRMQPVNHELDTSVNVTILGGLNGFGKIIGDTYDLFANSVIRTSRDPKCVYSFVLGRQASEKLIHNMMESDIVIMNATKTLDGDESVWNTTLSTFDTELLDDRIETNVYGYAKLLDQICKYRIAQLENNMELKRIVIVYTDANESKFTGKMVDCKHLELNIAKAGVKQIFYTNAYLFAKLNMLVMCYDPGWLSYHGISIEKKKARSPTLIPPNISANGIIFFANKMLLEFEQCMKQKQVIVDYSVYDYIKHILRM